MEDINERIMDEGYAINPDITSDEGYRIIPESSSDNKKKEDLKDERVYDLNNGADNLLGFISNEIYYPIKKDKKILKKDNDSMNKGDSIIDLSLGKIFQNTSECLNNFDTDFLNALHKTDLDFGFTNTENGVFNNIKRYSIAFMRYLNEGNNILYIGITLFIISIILYFINIIRRND